MECLKRVLRVLTIAVVLSVPAKAHDGPHDSPGDKTIKVGKQSRIKFGSDVLVDFAVLKRGRYLFQHRVENGLHVISFTQIGNEEWNQDAYTFESNLVASGERISHTRIFLRRGEQHDDLIKVEVAGEDWIHLLRSDSRPPQP
ncbi:MAG: hypothetical protein HY645_13085 [Acidobacteria bacterium]|nr:hypothetical protein [Acidobacteriota bacterium]